MHQRPDSAAPAVESPIRHGASTPESGWRVRHHPLESLPRGAWIALVRPPVADLYFGSAVVPSAAGIFEGTWVGGDGDLGPLRSTMPFGSGVLRDGGSLYLVPPGHMLEGIYVRQLPGAVIAANSLAGLVTATGLELSPDVAYPALFNESVDGVTHSTLPVSDGHIETWFHDNVRIDRAGRLTAVPKPREETFTDFCDYRRRLSAALGSALANAPGREARVTISSGYDGATVAVLATELGGTRAVTISDGKPTRGMISLSDSGEFVGRSLGMDVRSFERLAYQRRTDLPEAEFLATGFTGEEVVFSAMENDLEGSMLVSAFIGDGMWWMNRPPRPLLWRSDQSGSSFGEWRLRTGFVHVPLPTFGAHDYRVTQRISRSPEMLPWVLGRRYDKPIPRRILEEAGIPRGTFGEVKRAASGNIHSLGPLSLAPHSLDALRAFADAEGTQVTFKSRRLRLWDRAALKAARKVGAEPIAARLERRKLALAVTEPVFGSVLLRWAVSVVKPRYAEVADLVERAEEISQRTLA